MVQTKHLNKFKTDKSYVCSIIGMGRTRELFLNLSLSLKPDAIVELQLYDTPDTLHVIRDLRKVQDSIIYNNICKEQMYLQRIRFYSIDNAIDRSSYTMGDLHLECEIIEPNKESLIRALEGAYYE